MKLLHALALNDVTRRLPKALAQATVSPLIQLLEKTREVFVKYGDSFAHPLVGPDPLFEKIGISELSFDYWFLLFFEPLMILKFNFFNLKPKLFIGLALMPPNSCLTLTRATFDLLLFACPFRAALFVHI